MPAYPLIEFTLSVGGWETGDEAYPDTGFDGGLIIPSGVGMEILTPPALTPWRLADGSQRAARTWNGIIELHGRSFRIEVIAVGNRYLIGREILDQLEICFRFRREVALRFSDE